MNKKAQFYLIAAIIIIGVILGFAVYKNYAKSNKGNVVLYDLGKELKVETGNVYDYGVYNNLEDDILVENWVSKYYEYSRMQGQAEDWIFIYGNQAGMTAVIFSVADAGSVSIDTGSGLPISVNILANIKNEEDLGEISDDDVEVSFKGVKYNFELEDGQNFFFVIKSRDSAVT